MLTFAAMSQAPQEPANENDLPEVSIEDLSPALAKAVASVGWDKLMPVQSRAIPYVLEGRDVMVQARTGSGKTGAFVLPMLDRVDPAINACQALVLVPTRELAKQVGEQAEILGKSAGLRVIAVYGGVKYGGQLDAFRKGAHVVVGTPGRILDHLMRRTLNLDALRMLVFDEADRMLSMGFYPDMVRVKGFLPRRRVHSSMFSATFPHHVLSLANQFLHEPETLSLSEDHIHVTEVEHLYYDVPALKKDRCLVRLIEIDNPQAAIIFCNRKQTVGYVAAVLQNFGYDADALSADLSQAAREHVLQRVRDGKLKFLVATDVAARGLDIPELSHIYQYEPPEDPEAYIHRAGRTGRAGASGVAITLVSGPELMEIKRLSAQFKVDIVESTIPTEEEVSKVVAERAIALLEARLREADSLKRERLQRFLPLVQSLSAEGEEAELIALLVDDYYQKELHKPTAPIEAPRRERSGEGHGERGRDSRGGGRGRGGDRGPRHRRR